MKASRWKRWRPFWTAGLVCVLAWATTGSEGFAAWMDRGETLAAQKAYAAALDACRMATAWRPRAALPHLRAGQIYLRQRRFLEAEWELWQAYLLHPQNADTLLALGDLEMRRGAANAALLWYEKASILAPAQAEGHYALGMALLKKSAFSAAEQAFRQALAADETHCPSRYQLGLLLAPQDIEGALKHLRAATLSADGDTASHAHDMIAALAEVDTARSEGERSALLGVAYIRQRAWTLARAELERAISLWPENAAAYAFLGYALLQLGQEGAAHAHLERSLALNPENGQAHHFLAMLYRRLGWPHAALEVLTQAYDLDPRDPAIAAEIAQAYVEAGAYAEAESWFEEAAHLAPTEPGYALLQASFHVDHVYHIREKGIPASGRAIALAPAEPRAYLLLGKALFLSGDWGRAETALQQALALDSDLASAHLYLAEIYARQGRRSAAQASYRRAADLDTVGNIRQRALEALAGTHPTSR